MDPTSGETQRYMLMALQLAYTEMEEGAREAEKVNARQKTNHIYHSQNMGTVSLLDGEKHQAADRQHRFGRHDTRFVGLMSEEGLKLLRMDERWPLGCGCGLPCPRLTLCLVAAGVDLYIRSLFCPCLKIFAAKAGPPKPAAIVR
eukprot:Protomagalhaensia_sp_Gyna_25__2848@NODE_2656_length_960_cov_264_029316_g2215_i0_p3_GENE_NODE_2656_length_960_cov_264_029316_g2215_i0NODE_2656_length_960_cov_264_029316_g2215_i0_p3_ORF_typecomplete_len145_score25_46YopH_N/PF09013_10/0_16_NODE_2656_length_960_cov_264_029316_g2215_i0270704